MSKRPQDDMYCYVNEKWEKTIKIPKSYSKWSVFQELHEKKLKNIKKLLSNLNDKDKEDKILSIFHKQYLEKNSKDMKPYMFYINLINYTFVKNELIAKMGYLNQFGIGSLLGVDIIPDFKNSKYNILALTPKMLLLPDREYYLNKKKEKYVKGLENLMEKLLEIAKLDIDVKKSVKTIIEIQKRMAKIKLKKEILRDPEKVYNIFTIEKLRKDFPDFNWGVYFRACEVKTKEIIIEDVGYLNEFIKIFNEYPIQVFKNLLVINFILSVSSTMNDSIEEIIFDFYGKMLSGKKERKSKSKRSLEFVSGQVGEVLGKKYVKEYFPEKCKNKMLEIVNKLIEAYGNRLKKLTWMGKKTKVKALEKLKKMNVKIGYPEEFKDLTKLNISSENSLLKNALLVSKFYYDNEMSYLYRAPDPKEWFMLPYEINAYYSPLKNEIVFPAGILQYPFFNLQMELSEIYGGIGTIIGHEITHGFDDQGKKFDGDGNMVQWWTKTDEKKYNQNAKKIIEQFNNYKINGKSVNGKLTQGENIADLGGLVISLDALRLHQKKVTDADVKKFFEAWARNWRAKLTKKEKEKRLLTDPHSPNYFRVNGPLKNIDEFHRVYNTQSGDGMYLPKNKRIKIW